MEELLAIRPNPKLQGHPLSVVRDSYLIYSHLPSMLEAVPLSAPWGCAITWWLGPTYHGQILLKWRKNGDLSAIIIL